MDRKFHNLTWFENYDLQNIVQNKNKEKYNCYTPVKLNWIDKIIAKEHRYGLHRIYPFGIWILMGFFLPFLFLFMFILSQMGVKSADLVLGLSFILCAIIGFVIELIYQHSCDKIDYNYLVEKNQQMNLFNDFDVEYRYSDSYK